MGARFFAADLASCIRLADARKAENARARARCLANKDLTAVLLADAQRRGEPGIDWNGYFSRAGIL